MISIDELYIFMEMLEKKNRELTLEIELISAWIKEHRESRPARLEAGLLPAEKRDEYRSWRIVSCRLHQRRSTLKSEQEKVRTELLAVTRRIEEKGAFFSDLPDFSDIPLKTGFASAEACA